jgi:hypothetical protein
MSLFSTSANYGGRVDTQQGNVKQFVYSSNMASWVYKKLSNGLVVQSPPTPKLPVLINGDLIVTGSLYNTSDERLKENINNIDNINVDNLFILNPITYSYKSEQSRKKHYGFLAQDVEKVFPELIENNNISGYKTMNYQELIPVMLSKMKKMQDEIEQLKQTK